MLRYACSVEVMCSRQRSTTAQSGVNVSAGTSEVTIENEAIAIQIATTELAGSPRSFPHLSSLIHNALTPVLLEERIRIINNNSDPQRSRRSLLEFLFMLPLHMQAYVVTTHSRIIVGMLLIPKADVKS